jgi:hypothetical protein
MEKDLKCPMTGMVIPPYGRRLREVNAVIKKGFSLANVANRLKNGQTPLVLTFDDGTDSRFIDNETDDHIKCVYVKFDFYWNATVHIDLYEQRISQENLMFLLGFYEGTPEPGVKLNFTKCLTEFERFLSTVKRYASYTMLIFVDDDKVQWAKDHHYFI